MSSWAADIPLRRYRLGELVEVRDNAERGLEIIYRVDAVNGDGAVTASRVGGNAHGENPIRIAADDVNETLFSARTPVRARYGIS